MSAPFSYSWRVAARLPEKRRISLRDPVHSGQFTGTLSDIVFSRTQSLFGRRFPAPPWDRNVRKQWRSVTRTQWCSHDQLRKLQTRKLRRLIHHAYEKVPYYRQIMDERGLQPRDIRHAEDLQALPILTKRILKERYPEICATDFPRRATEARHTGGSTGARLDFHLDRRVVDMETAVRWRFFNWGGYRFGDRCASLYMPVESDPKSEPWCFFPQSNILRINTRDFTVESLERVTDKLLAFRPEILWGFPSHLYFLQRFLETRGVTDIRPRVIFTNAEMLYDHQRSALAGFFGCPVYDFYGNAENAASAAQCPKGRYHVNAELTVVEILSRERPVGEGEQGEVVGTCLESYAVPLIRYHTGDLATSSSESCPCGRELPVIGEIGGRTQDFLVTPAGARAFRHSVFSLDEIPNVVELQIVQEELRRFRLNVVPTPAYSGCDGEGLARMVRERLNYDVSVSITLVPTIPRTERGKFPLVVCNVPLPF